MKRLSLSVGTLAIVAGVLGAQPSGASTPDTSNVAVPNAGPKTVSATWTGTLAPGISAFLGTDLSSGQCSKGALTEGTDTHKINITVPAGAYNTVKAKLAFIVDSSPSPLNGDFIELVDPTGASVGADQQKKEMEVDVTNPMPGTWTALVCEFLPDQVPSHDYQAQIVIKTKCKNGAPVCPATKPKKKK